MVGCEIRLDVVLCRELASFHHHHETSVLVCISLQSVSIQCSYS